MKLKFRIGYRTIKTAVGTALSISLAQALGLESYVSAGILTILCIQVTRKKSLRASWDRFLACILAMLFAFVFFEHIAYQPLVIGFLLLFFIPTAVLFKAQDGIVSSSVILLHIFSAGKFTTEVILNELGIITIGIGVALVMNLYMPSIKPKLDVYQEQIEEKFKVIFLEIARYLRTNELDWDGKEITEAAKLIEEAKILAFQQVENQIVKMEEIYYQYFRIREKQFEIIERVLPTITEIQHMVMQRDIIADFIDELASGINPGNSAYVYLEKLMAMKQDFQNMEMPKTREEFEARSALLHFVNEMERYLIIKSSFKGLNNKNSRKKHAPEVEIS
ncbi:aromatic acid exporter family protein [Bacillus marasmi]|uniref:aromatic acid exporter family protein n=1 Tax=Bacillus marasmi TaxID=1926279 RepID=UPI0011C86CC8|nr:aromatic acid exporter family protein [Bacillus marasmi]